MMNSLALSKKIKVKPGQKANKNSNHAQLSKKSFCRLTLHREKIEGKTLELKETIILKPVLAKIKEEITNAEGKVDNTIANIHLTKEIDVCLKRKEIYQGNKTKIFSVTIGQCAELMISKLESKMTW
eukprot:14988938-Ditylum_brightwellii.AAC.1